MKIQVPNNIVLILQSELSKAGKVEIGGILMGEHLRENEFKLCDLTIQRQGGSFASFKRLVEHLTEPLRNFFIKTKRNYRQFNYLGEWHSHHSFSPYPSAQDNDTMYELINDRKFSGNFIVLMIVKLDCDEKVIGSVTVYQKNKPGYLGELQFDHQNSINGKC